MTDPAFQLHVVPDFPKDHRMKDRGGVVYANEPPHLDGCDPETCGRRCLCDCHTRARRARRD